MRLAAVLLLLALAAAPRAQAPDSLRAARLRLASADRARMMERLGVTMPDSLPPPLLDPRRPPRAVPRPGRIRLYDDAGNGYVRSEWGSWSNYDEAHASGRPLADPLVRTTGERVTTPAQWWAVRRPEILETYVGPVYGRLPAGLPAVAFEALGPDLVGPGGVRVRHVVGHIDNARYREAQPRIEMTLYLPAHAAGAVPVVVRVGGFEDAPADGSLPDPVRMAAARGWAFAVVDPVPVQMDSGAGFGTGIIGLANAGRPREPDDWGTLLAWAWGMSRALDYLEAAPDADASRAAIQGHSRWGKTALLAGALDTRWAAVFSSCSGAMGASLETRDWGETVDNVASAQLYHWMAGTFLGYAGRWEALPGDAHVLMALVAPRPLFVTGGTEDQWSDPHGEFLAAVAAEPVYTLLGGAGLGVDEMPAPDVSLTTGDLAFRNHVGGHTDAPDWPVFFEWVARTFGSPHGH